jgi:hypothetical protein
VVVGDDVEKSCLGVVGVNNSKPQRKVVIQLIGESVVVDVLLDIGSCSDFSDLVNVKRLLRTGRIPRELV